VCEASEQSKRKTAGTVTPVKGEPVAGCAASLAPSHAIPDTGRTPKKRKRGENGVCSCRVRILAGTEHEAFDFPHGFMELDSVECLFMHSDPCAVVAHGGQSQRSRSSPAKSFGM
jgi:hypothetical protein